MTKYYAVKVGKVPGIYDTWEAAKANIDGFEGAVFKSFSSLEDAKNFFEDKERDYDFSLPTAYIDGSFDEATNRYSFGCVFFYQGKEYHFKKDFPEDELSSMRNVAGEIKGAGFIILHCLNHGIKQLIIYHDYIGIRAWYNNEWKANLYGTQKYQEFANKVRNEIDVTFIKVKSHTNDKYNDLADFLAKEALGIN